MKDVRPNTATSAKQAGARTTFPPLRSVGNDATSYQGNQTHLVIAIPARSGDLPLA